MTLTVDIKFNHDLPLADIFAICQKAVNTPEGVKPIVKDGFISNPPAIRADCAMDCSLTDDGYQVSLDIPYVAAHELHGIASRVLAGLNVTKFKAHNEYDDTWHDNLDWLN